VCVCVCVCARAYNLVDPNNYIRAVHLLIIITMCSTKQSLNNSQLL